jgi:hypothetical protein
MQILATRVCQATKRGGINYGEDEEIKGAVDSGGFVYR